MDHLLFNISENNSITKNIKLAAGSHPGIPEVRNLPVASRMAIQPLTMKLAGRATTVPATIINEISTPSGGLGSHNSNDEKRKQILQIKATRKRSRITCIFSQKSVFLGKIPLFCRE
jgi:hypothetical protein